MPDLTPTPATPSLPPRRDLRARVLAGEPTVGLFLNLGSLVAADVIARTGYDWALVDLEHGLTSDPGVLAQLVAVQATPTSAIVRVMSAERLRVGRVLDLGADGLMIPRLESVGAVRETLSWMRYPPAGIRGVAALTRGAEYGAIPHPAIRTIDERILGVFQVESRIAVEAADEIAAIDGVDVLFTGPADLSHDLGVPGEFTNPTFLAALDRVAAAAARHGKAAGILLRDASEVPAYRARGYGFLGIGSDSGLVIRAAREQLAEARAGLG